VFSEASVSSPKEKQTEHTRYDADIMQTKPCYDSEHSVRDGQYVTYFPVTRGYQKPQRTHYQWVLSQLEQEGPVCYYTAGDYRHQ
jgi:hypothetical protein